MYCRESIKCQACDNFYCQKCSLLLEESYGMLTIICFSCFNKFNNNIIINNIIDQLGNRRQYSNLISDINDRKEYMIKYLNKLKNIDYDTINKIIKHIQSDTVIDDEIYLTQEHRQFLLNEIDEQCYLIDSYYQRMINNKIERLCELVDSPKLNQITDSLGELK